MLEAEILQIKDCDEILCCMIALSFAPNSSYIKKKRHLDPNDRKELRGSIIFRAAIRNCEVIGQSSLSKRTLTSRSGGYPLSLSAIFRLSYEYDTNEKA